MKNISTLVIATVCSLVVAGCENQRVPTAKEIQAEKAAQAANSIQFSENAEIENIKKRLELTANPGLIGYIVLLNEMGQPILYTGVKGKITSGSKRLTHPDQYACAGQTCGWRQAPSDEGTYGSSGEYIFFWTTDGQYIQWNKGYLYSDKPFRLTTNPLVIQNATDLTAK